jgi:hypothetical protein
MTDWITLFIRHYQRSDQLNCGLNRIFERVWPILPGKVVNKFETISPHSHIHLSLSKRARFRDLKAFFELIIDLSLAHV